jgi:hypothetical protein
MTPSKNMDAPSVTIARSYQGWASAQPQDIEAAQAHLLGLSAATEAASRAIEAAVDALLKQSWHPEVLAPLRDYAEKLAEARMLPAESYQLLLKRYQAQIDAAAQRGTEPTPEQTFFNGQGA